MGYLRKRNDYEKVYSKIQAIKELEDQPIIDKITKGIKCMTIHTIPIIPKKLFKGNEIFKYPVGTYIIKFTEKSRTISIDVKRKEGKLNSPRENSYHPHICTDFKTVKDWDEGFTDKICWGNIYKSVMKAKKNKDWYWLVKITLDLILDFNEGIYTGINYQIDYMKDDAEAVKKLLEFKKKLMKRDK